MIIILKCFLSFLNVLLACGFATFAYSSMLLPSFFQQFVCVPYHTIAGSLSRHCHGRRGCGTAAVAYTLGGRINANPPKGRSQIHLQRDVARQQR